MNEKRARRLRQMMRRANIGDFNAAMYVVNPERPAKLIEIRIGTNLDGTENKVKWQGHIQGGTVQLHPSCHKFAYRHYKKVLANVA